MRAKPETKSGLGEMHMSNALSTYPTRRLTAALSVAALGAGLAFASAAHADETYEQAKKSTAVAQDWLDGNITPADAPKVTYTGDTITMRASIQTPPPAVHTKVWLKEFALLEKMTGGKIKVELRHSGVVHKIDEGFEAIRSGLTDYTYCWGFLDASGLNLSLALQLPGLFPNGETMSIVAERLHQKYFRAEYDRHGVYLAHLDGSPHVSFFSRVPIRTIEDLSGRKVRSGGGIYADSIAALGATPLQMSSADFYTALQRGLLDVVTTADSAAKIFKVFEVAKHMTAPNVIRLPVETCVRPGFYDDLPADLKQIVNNWARGASQVTPQVIYRLDGAAARDFMIEKGMEIYEMPAAEEARWQERVAPIVEDFVAEQKAAGRPARQLINDIRAEVAKYGKMSPNDIMREVIEQPIQNFSH